MGGFHHLHLSGAIRMYALMIQELALHKEIDTLKELRDLWMIYHRHIQQSVIRHTIRSLPIARGIANTHRHHPALDNIRVDLDVHLVVQSLEYHEDKREDKREGAGTEEVMGLSAQVHNGGDKAHIDAVEEVAETLLPLLVGISDASKVYLSDSALLKPSHSLFDIAIVEAQK